MTHSIEKFTLYPGNPQTITDKEKARLEKKVKSFTKMLSIRKIVVDETWTILGGNKRFTALCALGYTEIPAEWVDQRTDLTEEEKKQFVLADNDQSGEWDLEKLQSWDLDLVADFGPSLDFDFSIEDVEQGKESPYVTTIKSPVYEIKGEKPELSDCFDESYTKSLLFEIQNANIPKPLKDFLKSAAQRHTIFNFENIAEYYAQSEPEVQRLFERSALVIIDSNQAIQNGFAQMIVELQQNQIEDGYEE